MLDLHRGENKQIGDEAARCDRRAARNDGVTPDISAEPNRSRIARCQAQPRLCACPGRDAEEVQCWLEAGPGRGSVAAKASVFQKTLGLDIGGVGFCGVRGWALTMLHAPGLTWRLWKHTSRMWNLDIFWPRRRQRSLVVEQATLQLFLGTIKPYIIPRVGLYLGYWTSKEDIGKDMPSLEHSETGGPACDSSRLGRV